jgi:hypothetical protein
MKLSDLLKFGFGNVLRVLEYTLEGQSPEALNWQPRPDCNSMGWLAWHLTRWQDVAISSFMGEEQVWIKDKWYEKFGRGADDKDHGLGHKQEDLAGFKAPDAQTLLDYQRAVLERNTRYFDTVKAADLDKKVEGTHFDPPPTIGMMLMGTLSDGLQHAGQASYIRGMREGMGWH